MFHFYVFDKQVIRIGLFGLGHLGKIHLKCLRETDFQIMGIYDPLFLPEQYGSQYEDITLHSSIDTLIDKVDACVIASSTASHYSIAYKALSRGKHCFIEKPLTSTIQEAEELEKIVKSKSGLITQIGFVERYNPAYKFVKEHTSNPKFIEVHRLAQFNNRGNDVSVIFDLMIHDLDLLMTLKSVKVTDIKATGVSIFTESLDICNCRIEFEDGCVANLTASRMSMKVMRKFRIFQEDAYLAMDLHKKEGQVISLTDRPTKNSLELHVGNEKKHILLKSSGTPEGNAILEELIDFSSSIKEKSYNNANISSGVKTLRLAEQIETIAQNNGRIL